MGRKKGRGIEPCWVDGLVMALGRPWVFVLAFAFILVPSKWLIAGFNSGAAFLKIGAGARPAALGGAYTALADDVNALYYNPGGLARLRHKELGATHSKWLLGTTFDFIGYAHPTQNGTFGMGLTRLAAGSTEGRSADRTVTSTFDASDMAYTFGYGRRFAGLGLGANMKFLKSQLAGYSAQTVAFDLGAQHKLSGRPLSLGLSVLNIGEGMKFLDQIDPLPLTFAAGAAYRFGGALQVVLDVRHEVYDKRTDIGVGTEYALLPQFSVRAGYASGAAQAASGSGGTLGGLAGLGGGFGLKAGRYRADYTITPFGQLGNAQKISLGARF